MQVAKEARSHLLQIYQAGISRVSGRPVVRDHLTNNGEAVSVIAIGKAAFAMFQGAADVLGSSLDSGLVITKQGHWDGAAGMPSRVECIEGGHPEPDERSIAAGDALLRFLGRLPADQPLLFLISGGASSLVEVPRPGVPAELIFRANRWLLGSGLPIGSINRVRKTLSMIKGGGLLNYLGQRSVEALLISDVPGDDPAVIGSGLLAAGRGNRTLEDLALPSWLQSQPEQAGDAIVSGMPNVVLRVVATLQDARLAAAEKAQQLGYPVKVSHAHISAEAENAGRRLALELLDANPGVYIWGGEPSVVLPSEPGRGGRNQHLALSAATVISGRDDCFFLAAGTDGTDGPGEDAGALVDGGTLGRGRREGLEAEECLRRADSGHFLQASGDLINTGPTGTNVMDLMIGLKR